MTETSDLLLTATAALALLVAAVGWRSTGNRPVAAILLACLGVAGVVAWGVHVGQWNGNLPTPAVATAAALLAVTGGGPVTAAVFRVVDGPGAPGPGSVRRAGDVLRGGAWIGALERIAVCVALLAGWPEGLALTLALKGLGRYPELRHEDRPGIAERFLIGTFVSVLWACACAGVAHLLIG